MEYMTLILSGVSYSYKKKMPPHKYAFNIQTSSKSWACISFSFTKHLWISPYSLHLSYPSIKLLAAIGRFDQSEVTRITDYPNPKLTPCTYPGLNILSSNDPNKGSASVLLPPPLCLLVSSGAFLCDSTCCTVPPISRDKQQHYLLISLGLLIPGHIASSSKSEDAWVPYIK